MTDEQWKKLTAVIGGEVIEPLPVGFIIDSPWLPGWAGISIKDYFSNEQMWFEANLKAVRQFPDIISCRASGPSLECVQSRLLLAQNAYGEKMNSLLLKRFLQIFSTLTH